jgi:hypothetical protein
MIPLCQVRSDHTPGQRYLVTWDGQRLRCSCAGHAHRGHCRHVSDRLKPLACPVFLVGSQWLVRWDLPCDHQTVRSEAGRLADLVGRMVHGRLGSVYVCGVGPHEVPA